MVSSEIVIADRLVPEMLIPTIEFHLRDIAVVDRRQHLDLRGRRCSSPGQRFSDVHITFGMLLLEETPLRDRSYEVLTGTIGLTAHTRSDDQHVSDWALTAPQPTARIIPLCGELVRRMDMQPHRAG
jgi:hypothetical protein